MNLKEYMMSINEEAGKRGRPKKTDAQRKAELDNAKKKPISQDKIKPEQVDSKSLMPSKQEVWGRYAGQNGSGGVWEVDVPKGKDNYPPLDDATMNRNLKKLRAKFASKEDFFIQGEAGWGKTSLIIDMAGRYDRFVVTVYLDKAEATDLGGIPTVGKGKSGRNTVEYSPMPWMEILFDNPTKKYLLFFDEMNQAAPDVMNALMPIVLKNVICGKQLHNFVVGAAGNFEDENEGGVNELSKPLLSRFGGIITWQSGDWDNAFQYMHKKWDSKLGKELIDKLQENADLFKNPRDVENHVIELLNNLKEDGEIDLWDASDYLDNLKDLTIDEGEMTRTQISNLEKLADFVYAYMNGKTGDDKKKNKRGQDMVSDDIKACIKHGMEYGYVDQEEEDSKGNIVKVRYGISRENIVEVYTDEGDINAEMLERLISRFEEDGIKFKFDKDSQWQEKGYKDPMQLKNIKDLWKDFIKNHTKESEKKEKKVDPKIMTSINTV